MLNGGLGMIVIVITISITVVCVVLLIGEVRRYRAMATNKPREPPPRHTFKSPRVHSWSIVWMISLIFICLSIVAYGWLYPRALFLTIVPSPASIDPAYLQGYNLSCGVLIWLVFRSTIGRTQGGAEECNFAARDFRVGACYRAHQQSGRQHRDGRDSEIRVGTGKLGQ